MGFLIEKWSFIEKWGFIENGSFIENWVLIEKWNFYREMGVFFYKRDRTKWITGF
jgi:hypothetical protein